MQAGIMYLERVFGTDSHWLSSSKIAAYPDLRKTMESLRCVRNCIVHNACKINPAKSNCEKVIRDYDAEVRAGNIKDELNPRGGNFEPYYSIEPDGTLDLSGCIGKVRWRTVAYLMAEEIVKSN